MISTGTFRFLLLSSLIILSDNLKGEFDRGLENQSEMSDRNQDNLTEALRRGRDNTAQTFHRSPDNPTETLHGGPDNPTETLHGGPDNPTETLLRRPDNPTETLHGGPDNPTETLHGGPDNPTETLHGGPDNPTETLHGGPDNPTETLHGGPDNPTETLHGGPDNPTETLHGGPDNPTETLLRGPDNPTETLHGGPDNPTETLHGGPDNPTETLHGGPDNPTETLHGGPDNPTETLHGGPDNPTETLHGGPDNPTETLHGGPDNPTETLHGGPDNPTETLHGGPDNPTETLHGGPDNPTETLHGGPDNPTETLHGGPDNPTETLQGGPDNPTETLLRGPDNPTETLHGGPDNPTETSHRGLDSSIETIYLGPANPTEKLHRGLDNPTKSLRRGRYKPSETFGHYNDNSSETYHQGLNNLSKSADHYSNNSTKLFNQKPDSSTSKFDHNYDSSTESFGPSFGKTTETFNHNLFGSTSIFDILQGSVNSVTTFDHNLVNSTGMFDNSSMNSVETIDRDLIKSTATFDNDLDNSIKAFDKYLDFSTAVLYNGSINSTETFLWDLDTSTVMFGYDSRNYVETLDRGLGKINSMFNDYPVEKLDQRLDSSNPRFRHHSDISADTFDQGLDSSTLEFSHNSENLMSTFHEAPDSSTTMFGYDSDSSTPMFGHDSDSSTPMFGHDSDSSTTLFGHDSDSSTTMFDHGSDSSNKALAHSPLISYENPMNRSNKPEAVSALQEYTEDVSSDSCEQRCGYVIAATEDNLHPCHCDQTCWLYGDCCSDYYSTCLHININATSERILHAVLDNLRTYSQVLQLHEGYLWSRVSYCLPLNSNLRYIQMVNKCSDDPKILVQFEDLHRDLTNPMTGSADVFVGLSKQEIRQRCAGNEQNYTTTRMLDFTYVTLNNQKAVHFYNVFCAICNGINPNKLLAWVRDVTCENRASFKESSLFLNDSIYETIIRNKCTVTNIPPPTRHLRACAPHVWDQPGFSNQQKSRNYDDGSVSYIESTCMSWNQTTWLLCQRYQNHYRVIEILIFFKNLHCLVCYLHALAEGMNSGKEQILSSQNKFIMWISKYENDLYVCKSRSHTPLAVNLLTDFCKQYIYDGRELEKSFVVLMNAQIISHSALFNFNQPVKTETVDQIIKTIENKTCPQDQLYVPLHKSCRQVLCLPGTRWLHDQCVNVSSDTDTSKNESSRVPGNQNFDYIFLPCPDGCEIIRLNIALDYIFGEDSLTDSLSNKLIMISNEDSDGCGDDDEQDDYVNVKSFADSAENISARKTIADTVDESRRNINCSQYNYSMSLLFELSNLKNVWVKQTKKKINSTESKQNVYHEMVNIVLRDIHITIIHHLDPSSQIGHIIVCPNSTCFTNSVNVKEIDKDQPKVYPYNPCFDGSSKYNKTKSGTFKRPDVCLSFVVHMNSSEHFDNFVNATKTMVSDIVSSAHETNFVLSSMEITNIINFRNDTQTQDMGTWNSLGSDVRFGTSSSELCQINEVLVSTETDVEQYNNGTHFVTFNGKNIELVKFGFNMEIYRHLNTPKNGIHLTTVSWCQVNINQLNCGSFQITVYEPEYFVIYNGTLVLTLMADKLRQFLHEKQTKGEITETMKSFAGQCGDNNWTVVHNGSYIQIRSGALVCSNLTNMYHIEKDNLYTEMRLKPDSKAEIVATVIAYVLSIFCLACTLAVYSMVPPLRNVPGKIVMAFSATLLCAQVLFLCCTKPKGLACEVYASVHHAAWLSSYTWLGSMSVHLARILNSQCNIHIPVSGSNIFQILSAVCWGIPCLLAGVCLALHKTQLITIGYGNNGVCWIGSYKPLLLFFGVPVFLILAVTLVCSVVVLRAIRKSIIFRSKSTVVQGKPHKQLILCVNLSLLMGFSWVFYFLAVGIDNTIVWTLHILVNGSQGLYVFLCFAARRSHLSTLITKLKLVKIWARKQNVSSDITSLKMSPTAVTLLDSPSPSVRSFTISK